jgi:hypothetical protein
MLPEGSMEVDPNWSPDGNQIMFGAVRTPRPGKPAPTGDIRILDLRTHQVRLLPESEGLTAPRWSSDGRYVAAGTIAQPNPGEAAVRLYDFSRGKWTDFEQDPIDNKWWSHDGNYFYFDKFPEIDPAVFRLRVSDRSLEKVATLRNVRRAWGNLGWWLGLSPDDAPIVLRDTSIEEIYSLNVQKP